MTMCIIGSSYSAETPMRQAERKTIGSPPPIGEVSQ